MRRHFFWGRPTAFRLRPRLVLGRRRSPRGGTLSPGGGYLSPGEGRGRPLRWPPNPWRRLALGLGTIFALAVSSVFLLDVLLWPTLRTLAQAELQNLAVVGMYEAVRTEMTESGLDYRRLFRVETNETGQVTFMQPDTVMVNDLAARVAVAIQDEMAGLGTRTIYVPLGRAFGSRLLGGVGPRIGVKIYPLMLESVKIWDTFESAGINQTRHRIYLNVKLVAKTAVPFILSEVPVEGDFPIAEAIIVGQVPDTYVGGMWLPFFPREAGDT